MVHEICVINELISVFILVALRLVLHVFKSNWVPDYVFVCWCILFRYLVVEIPMRVVDLHLIKDFLEDLIERLVAGLLSLALTFVVHAWLNLVIKIFFTESE